ncbi:MAG: hypothetical protein IKZ25_04890, partial [Clostridia bacterium]|nr:hypothetical protein [Clostridia bacterium]
RIVIFKIQGKIKNNPSVFCYAKSTSPYTVEAFSGEASPSLTNYVQLRRGGFYIRPQKESPSPHSSQADPFRQGGLSISYPSAKPQSNVLSVAIYIFICYLQLKMIKYR